MLSYLVVCGGYIRLSLGLTKANVIDFLPLVSRCERRLAFTSSFLSQAGGLEVTNSIFTSFPMFFMSTFWLHKTVIKQVDSYRKHSLCRHQWQKTIQSSMGLSLFAKKNEGGSMGPDIITMVICLHPQDILKLLDSFKVLAMVNVFDGATCFFSEDLWLNKVPRIHYPYLFSFV